MKNTTKIVKLSPKKLAIQAAKKDVVGSAKKDVVGYEKDFLPLECPWTMIEIFSEDEE